jgi:hypothetical protein
MSIHSPPKSIATKITPPNLPSRAIKKELSSNNIKFITLCQIDS